jgi:hypothetical protein
VLLSKDEARRIAVNIAPQLIDRIGRWVLRLRADHPAFIFRVVGQSRDDALTVVQAGSHHPGSQKQKHNKQMERTPSRAFHTFGKEIVKRHDSGGRRPVTIHRKPTAVI